MSTSRRLLRPSIHDPYPAKQGLAGAQHIVAVEGRPQRAALAGAMGADIVLEPGDEVRGKLRGLGIDFKKSAE